MIKSYFIEEIANIWRIHFDVEANDIYIELRYETEFELRSVKDNRRFKTPKYEQYVQNILSVQYPYALISYRTIDNLLEDQIIVMYNLEKEKEEWMSSEFRVEEVFNKCLRVYHPKISPKQTYLIDFNKDIIDSELNFTRNLVIKYAENSNDGIVIKDVNRIYHYSVTDQMLNVFENNELYYSDSFELEELYNKEYDYMLMMNNALIVLLGKHKLKLYEV